jgi:hypothetical protein
MNFAAQANHAFGFVGIGIIVMFAIDVYLRSFASLRKNFLFSIVADASFWMVQACILFSHIHSIGPLRGVYFLFIAIGITFYLAFLQKPSGKFITGILRITKIFFHFVHRLTGIFIFFPISIFLRVFRFVFFFLRTWVSILVKWAVSRLRWLYKICKVFKHKKKNS